ncbi:unnamed protein product [Trichobilharzia szidati]|nr:unnamed protein product [Trichobilharzia szidati]
MFEDKLGKPIEKEFIKSRDNAERKCLRMSGMQLDQNATDQFLTKSYSKNGPMSEFKDAVVQLISEVEKVEKQRIHGITNMSTMSIIRIVSDAMFREARHEFGTKDE